MIDPPTDKVLGTVATGGGAQGGDLPIGRVSDGGGFDPVHKRAFSSNSEGTLSVVDAADPGAVPSFDFKPGTVNPIALDPR